jgi:hypothetical protein
MNEERAQLTVREKIRAETRKKGKSLARTRGREGEICIENTKNLQELLAPHLPKAIRSWIDGLKATKIAWQHDKWVDTGFPDWKERRECGRQIVEYVIGKAIERSMEVTGSYKELSEVLSDLEKSPEARRLLSPDLFKSSHKASSVESAPATVERETISQPEHNTSNVQSEEQQAHGEKDISDSEQKTG